MRQKLAIPPLFEAIIWQDNQRPRFFGRDIISLQDAGNWIIRRRDLTRAAKDYLTKRKTTGKGR